MALQYALVARSDLVRRASAADRLFPLKELACTSPCERLKFNAHTSVQRLPPSVSVQADAATWILVVESEVPCPVNCHALESKSKPIP
jgi:hypothetical protein